MMTITMNPDVLDIFSEPRYFPAVIFSMDELGPRVAFRDFEELWSMACVLLSGELA